MALLAHPPLAPWGSAALGAALLLSWCALLLQGLHLWRMRRGRHRAEQLLAGLAGAADDEALFALDAAGCITLWAAGAERLYGHPAAGMLGRPYAELFTPAGRAARQPQDDLETAAREGRCRRAGERLRTDRGRLLVEARLQALRDAEGRLAGFVVLERDVGERIGRQRVIDEMRAALAQSVRFAALGRLCDGIAHDFSNVALVIGSCAEALQRRLAGRPESAELLPIIRRNVERASRLAQQLLGIAHRPLIASPTPTNVNEVIAGVVELLRQTFSEAISIEAGADESLPWVTIERTELAAALLHLAADARDAMPGGGRVIFRSGVSRGESNDGEHHEVWIAVSDTRHAQQAAAAAGERSATAAAALAPVGAWLEHRGGRLRVHIEPDAGVTVRLYLPLRVGRAGGAG